MSKDPEKQSHPPVDAGERIWMSKSELNRLQTSLQEAQETLDAIRNGEVDAIVVSENQVYTLAGAEYPYRVYVEQMQEGAVTVDAGGIILYCNQKFAEMVGTPLERVISSNISGRLSAQAWETISSVIGGTQSVVKCESYLGRENGVSLPVNLSASTLPLSGQTVICLVVTDLTLQKVGEKLQLAKEVAERANLAKDNFLAILSHELRTPLTPALVAISALEEDGALPPQVMTDLSMIRRNIEVEARLIDDLLDITRIAHGKLELQEATLDLHVVLRRAIDVCLSVAEAKRANVTVTLNATDTVSVGDAMRLQQVFWNVIHNAIKFTPAGGSIRISTQDAGPRLFQVTVTDSGIGFDPADAPKIFESFEQAGQDRARRFGGLGLGLSISRSIVIAHGGEIWGESLGSNLGANFHIRLPLRQPVYASLSATDAHPTSHSGGGLRTERTMYPMSGCCHQVAPLVAESPSDGIFRSGPMYELITSACKVLDTFGLPRAIGNLQTGRLIAANNSFLRTVGLEEEELSSTPLSEIVKTHSEPLDSAKVGGLVPVTLRGSENGGTIAGHAALGRNSLVFLMIPTAVDPSPDFELGTVFGEEVERQKMAVYLHKNLAPEFMTAVFSIESVRLQLEKENHPCEAQLKDVQERITEPLQRMRQELERSETERREFYLMSRHLAAIVQNSDDAIIGKDLNSVITSWNKGAERIFGYSAEEMIGNSIRRIIPPDRQHEEDEILARLRQGQRCDHFETVRVTKEGRRLYVSLTISPIKDESGKVVGASKIARDITERKLAEEALREAKRKGAAGKKKLQRSGETRKRS